MSTATTHRPTRVPRAADLPAPVRFLAHFLAALASVVLLGEAGDD
ncbi:MULTISPECIES: hypothetical protein [Actinosynnema]|uniref:Uncharacterized protein n=1 Tax=Actinosynnema mirum (strain ATCC 29888 / DSM 43827 / JCM 3225 / NBRC 14064 / NCIMB 13271 / NRRL B-12336 / IMRU 3971 / 101) TaxID=446462 RepID=C6W8X6_ACTMD|nr:MULTISPECIES: hypothetical protein [Actinosynnema]ACU39048.1 hypothetical protein Amir_5227 [Actinosynnema mirum DSM 43827]AXX32642.1 hypothetical protein APASM_5277 [Actinosynnema pretiosum subsp. pretiosum]